MQTDKGRSKIDKGTLVVISREYWVPSSGQNLRKGAYGVVHQVNRPGGTTVSYEVEVDQVGLVVLGRGDFSVPREQERPE